LRRLIRTDWRLEVECPEASFGVAFSGEDDRRAVGDDDVVGVICGGESAVTEEADRDEGAGERWENVGFAGA
jgi:hypothetical protein